MCGRSMEMRTPLLPLSDIEMSARVRTIYSACPVHQGLAPLAVQTTSKARSEVLL